MNEVLWRMIKCMILLCQYLYFSVLGVTIGIKTVLWCTEKNRIYLVPVKGLDDGRRMQVIIGPSGVRALPLAAGINVGGHY